MAITIYTDAEISAQVDAFFRTRFAAKDLGPTSFLGKLSRAVAMALVGLQKAIKDADNDATPSKDSSSAALQRFAVLFGLSDGDGGYGYKKPTLAAGGIGPCTGTNGTVFTAGDELVASDGVTLFELAASVTIVSGGTVTGNFTAVTPGTAGNLEVGSVLTWQSPPSGADATVTLTQGLLGGTDTETDAEALERIFDRLQSPPKGGVAADYRVWAEATPDAGVHRAYVYPLRGGLGTVHIVITIPGTGTGRDPGAPIQALVDAYVEDLRPVTVSDHTIFRPYQPGDGLTIQLRMIPSLAKYDFDWASGGTPYYVDAYLPTGGTAGAPAVRLTTNVTGSSLTDAIAAGDPRIQVASDASTHAAIPVTAVVTDHTVSAGKSILTLQAAIAAADQPTGSGLEPVFPGGPMVATIAQAVLDYVDALGPSRVSGYADSSDLWSDTASIAKLIQVGLDQLDSDGLTHFASDIVSNGVTIDTATSNVQAEDNTASGPELLFAKWIFVTD